MIVCPKCGKSKPANPKVAGQRIACPQCKFEFVAPTLTAQPVQRRDDATEPDRPGGIAGRSGLRRWLPALIAVGLAFVVVAGIVGYMLISGLAGGVRLPLVGVGKEFDFECKAYDFSNDYVGGATQNIAKADSMYMGKRLRVTGAILKVEKVNGYYWVGIETGPNHFPVGERGVIVKKASIVAEIPESERDAVAALGEFDMIVVDGDFISKTSDDERMDGMLLLLKNAKIVKHTPAKK